MDVVKAVTRPEAPQVERYAEAPVPTVHGATRIVVYRERGARGAGGEPREHVALVVGEPERDPDRVLVRVHSECITSEVFGSLKCDCREQFDQALARMVEHGSGILIYLRQEGRGIGLGNKIRAYALQAQGLDTIAANHQLGFATDLRKFDIAGEMLKDLGVRGVRLLTNNPEKVDGIESTGLAVVERVPAEIEPNVHSFGYLATKQAKLGHMLNLIATL